MFLFSMIGMVKSTAGWVFYSSRVIKKNERKATRNKRKEIY